MNIMKGGVDHSAYTGYIRSPPPHVSPIQYESPIGTHRHSVRGYQLLRIMIQVPVVTRQYPRTVDQLVWILNNINNE